MDATTALLHSAGVHVGSALAVMKMAADRLYGGDHPKDVARFLTEEIAKLEDIISDDKSVRRFMSGPDWRRST